MLQGTFAEKTGNLLWGVATMHVKEAHTLGFHCFIWEWSDLKETRLFLTLKSFPVVMHWCKSWTIKKAEHWRTDVFNLWCWRRFFRVPWTARRSNQSILKEINPEYSLEGLMLKCQYFGHLMRRVDSLEKTLMLGKTEGKMRRGW